MRVQFSAFLKPEEYSVLRGTQVATCAAPTAGFFLTADDSRLVVERAVLVDRGEERGLALCLACFHGRRPDVGGRLKIEFGVTHGVDLQVCQKPETEHQPDDGHPERNDQRNQARFRASAAAGAMPAAVAAALGACYLHRDLQSNTALATLDASSGCIGTEIAARAAVRAGLAN